MGLQCTEILKELNSLPSGQLVLVRYKPDHDVLIEWVGKEAAVHNVKAEPRTATVLQ